MIDLSAIRKLRAAGQHDEAQRQLIGLAAQYPNDPIVQYETACIHDFLGQEGAAVPYYLAAIRNGLAGEDLQGAYLGLGSTYRALGQYAASKQTLLEGLTHFPQARELRVFLAMTLYNLGEYHQAAASLLELIADTTSDPAIQGYERAIRLYAENLDRKWES